MLGEMHEAFTLIDAGIGGGSPKGYCDIDGFYQFMRVTGSKCHQSHIRNLIKRVDVDGSGQIEFEEVL